MVKRIKDMIEKIIRAIEFSSKISPVKAGTLSTVISGITGIEPSMVTIELDKTLDQLDTANIVDICDKYSKFLVDLKQQKEKGDKIVADAEKVLTNNQPAIDNINVELEKCIAAAAEAAAVSNKPEEEKIEEAGEADTESQPIPRVRPRYNGVAKYMFRIPDNDSNPDVVLEVAEIPDDAVGAVGAVGGSRRRRRRRKNNLQSGGAPKDIRIYQFKEITPEVLRILTSLRSPAVLLKDKDLMETLIPQSISTIDAGDANFADEYRRIEADGLTGENTDFLSIGKKEAVYKRSIMKLMRHVDETPSSAPPPGQPSCVYYYEQLWAFMNVNDTIQPIRSILGVSERDFTKANTIEDIRKILNWTKDSSNFLLYNNSQFVDNQKRLSIFKILSTQNGNVSQFLITNSGKDYRRMLNWSILIAFCCMLENNTLKLERIRELVENIHYAFLGWVEREKKTTGGDIFLKKSNTAKDTYRDRVLTILLGDIKTDRTLEPLITAIQAKLLSLGPVVEYTPHPPLNKEQPSGIRHIRGSRSVVPEVNSVSPVPPVLRPNQQSNPPFGLHDIVNYKPAPHPPSSTRPQTVSRNIRSPPRIPERDSDSDSDLESESESESRRFPGEKPPAAKPAWEAPQIPDVSRFQRKAAAPRRTQLPTSPRPDPGPDTSRVFTPTRGFLDLSMDGDRPPPGKFDPTESKRLLEGIISKPRPSTASGGPVRRPVRPVGTAYIVDRQNPWLLGKGPGLLPQGPPAIPSLPLKDITRAPDVHTTGSQSERSLKPVPPPSKPSDFVRRMSTSTRNQKLLGTGGGNKRTRKHPRIARRRAHHKTIRRAAAVSQMKPANHKYTRKHNRS